MQQVSLHDYCEDAGSLIQSGDTHKAIQITRHILRHYPRHVQSYRLLGQALLALGVYHEAARQFRRVLSADPEDVSSRVGLAEIHQATGDLDKAVWHMQRAVDLAPGDPDLRARLGQLSDARQGDGRSESIELTRAALGRIHAHAGLRAKAAQEFKAVLSSNPDRADVQTALAEVLWQSGDYLEATQICQRILEKVPNALKANLMVGALWLQNRQLAEAQPYLELAQELDPENLVAQSFFGEASPLPSLEVKIEALGEDEIHSVQFGPPPTSSQEDVPAFEEQEPAIDWMSDSHEEESKPMNDEERSDEEFELPDWLKGVGDDLLDESDDQPVASSPPGSDSDEGEATPDWLRDLVARAEDADTSQESVSAEPGDVPDWLQELRPEIPEETPSGSDTPDWLESTTAGQPPDEYQTEPVPGATEPKLPEVEPVVPEAAGAPTPGETDDQFSWEQLLAEEGVDLGAIGEVPPPEAAGMTPEEWLRSTADFDETPQAAEEPALPDEEPLVEEAQTPVIPVAQTEADDVDIPDWLREIRDGEKLHREPDAEPAVEKPKPSLLEPLSDVVEESDVPDWLREVATGEPVPTEGAVPVAEPSEPAPEAEDEDIGLPDWLRDLEEPAAEEEAAQAEPVAPELAAEPTASADEGRALWEQILAEEGVDLSSVEEAPPPEAAGMTAEEWLRSTADLEERPGAPGVTEPIVEEPSTKDLEVPTVPVVETELDWLEDVGEPEPFLALEGEPTAEEAEPAEEVPGWMRELQEPQIETEEPLEAVVDEALDEAVEVEVDEAGLPDWLREPTAEAAEFVEPEAGPPAETPEWLAELESEDMLLTEADFEEPIELETGEMPEWLGEVMAEETPFAEEWAAEPAEAEAQEEQIPDWLREFRDQAREPQPEPTPEVEAFEAPAEVEEEAQYAEPSELPDWLLHLREGVSEAQVPELPEVEVPPEAEVVLPELEMIQPEVVGSQPVEELVAAEQDLVEPEVIEEEVSPTPEEAFEFLEAEIPAVAPEPELEPVEAPEPELAEAPVPEPAEAPVPELLVTRKLEAPRVEDLPKDPAARLSLARAAFNTGDWADALTIYETLVSSSELLDSVIDNLEVGVRRYPHDPAGYQLLGDACMKDGRLHAALEAYRTALSKI